MTSGCQHYRTFLDPDDKCNSGDRVTVAQGTGIAPVTLRFPRSDRISHCLATRSLEWAEDLPWKLTTLLFGSSRYQWVIDNLGVTANWLLVLIWIPPSMGGKRERSCWHLTRASWHWQCTGRAMSGLCWDFLDFKQIPRIKVGNPMPYTYHSRMVDSNQCWWLGDGSLLSLPWIWSQNLSLPLKAQNDTSFWSEKQRHCGMEFSMDPLVNSNHGSPHGPFSTSMLDFGRGRLMDHRYHSNSRSWQSMDRKNLLEAACNTVFCLITAHVFSYSNGFMAHRLFHCVLNHIFPMQIRPDLIGANRTFFFHGEDFNQSGFHHSNHQWTMARNGTGTISAVLLKHHENSIFHYSRMTIYVLMSIMELSYYISYRFI